MENRGQKHHRERLGEALREEIVALVEGELGDPRIGLVSVNEVQMAAGRQGRRASSSRSRATSKRRSRAWKA